MHTVGHLVPANEVKQAACVIIKIIEGVVYVEFSIGHVGIVTQLTQANAVAQGAYKLYVISDAERHKLHRFVVAVAKVRAAKPISRILNVYTRF